MAGPDRLGPYEVRAKLAEGGMAIIYLGRRVVGSGPPFVALKVIKEEYAKNPEFVDMFVDEARIVAKLDHPNIVKLYDAGREGDRLYFAMELLMGQSLWNVWQACRERTVRVRYDLAAYVGARVAEGLHHAHELRDAKGVSQELVHRDVNQTNIFLTYDGQVKVIDFGLAKALGRISRTGAGVVKGKLAYMSPEQTTGRRIDRRTDVFALGTTLYEITVDQRLFRGKDDAATLRAVHDAAVPDAQSLVAGYPTWLWEVVKKSLARDASDRYQSAEEMARALDACSLMGGRRLSATSVAEVLAVLFQHEQSRQAAWFAEASAPDLADAAMPTLRPPTAHGSFTPMGLVLAPSSELFAPPSAPPEVPGDAAKASEATPHELPAPPKIPFASVPPAVRPEDPDRTTATSRTPQRTGPSFAVMLLAACVAIGLVGAVLALLLR